MADPTVDDIKSFLTSQDKVGLPPMQTGDLRMEGPPVDQPPPEEPDQVAASAGLPELQGPDTSMPAPTKMGMNFETSPDIASADDVKAFLADREDQDRAALRQRATGIINMYRTDPNFHLPDEWLDSLAHEATAGTTWQGQLGATAKGIADMSARIPGSDYPSLLVPSWETTKAVGGAIGGAAKSAAEFISEIGNPNFNRSDVRGGLAHGVTAGATGLASLAENALQAGAAPFEDAETRVQRLKEVWQQEHDQAQATQKVDDLMGYQKGSAPGSEAVGEFGTQVGAFAAAPELGLGGAIPKATEKLVEDVIPGIVGGAGRAAPAVVKGAGQVALYAAKGTIPGASRAISLAKGIGDLIEKAAPKASTLPEAAVQAPAVKFTDLMKGLTDAPEGMTAFEPMKVGVSNEISRLNTEFQTIAKGAGEKVDLTKVQGTQPDGTFSVRSDFLNPEERKLRQIQVDLASQRSKYDTLDKYSKFADFAKDATKLGVSSGLTMGAGGATLGSLAAIQAAPDDVEQAAKEGAQMGVALSTPALLPEAMKTLQTSRVGRLRAAGDYWAAKGAAMEPHPMSAPLSTTGQRVVNIINGGIGDGGGRAVAVSPEDLAKVSGSDPAHPPAGWYDPESMTAYLRNDKVEQYGQGGVAGHEFSHVLDQLTNDTSTKAYSTILDNVKNPAVGGKVQDFLYNYMDALRKSDPTAKTLSLDSLMGEGAAELTRYILSKTPLEELLSGKSITKTIGDKISDAVAAVTGKSDEVLNAPGFGTPFTRAQYRAMENVIENYGRQVRRGEITPKESGAAPAPQGQAPEVKIPSEVSKLNTEGRWNVPDEFLKAAVQRAAPNAAPADILIDALKASKEGAKAGMASSAPPETPQEGTEAFNQWSQEIDRRVKEYTDQGIPEDQAVVMVSHEMQDLEKNKEPKGQGLEAKFMPSTHPDAIKDSYVEMPDGKKFFGLTHWDAMLKAINSGRYPEAEEGLGSEEALMERAKSGFRTKTGRLLDRDQASAHAKSIGQYENPEGGGLEALDFNEGRKFMPDFYSPTAKVIDQKMPERAPAKQVLALLAGGNKAEVEWSGARDFVESHGDKPVNKQDVLDFLNKGLPQLTETQFGNKSAMSYNDIADEMFGAKFNSLDPQQQADVAEQFKHEYENHQYDSPELNLPGGTNYRELLQKLPHTSEALSIPEPYDIRPIDPEEQPNLVSDGLTHSVFPSKESMGPVFSGTKPEAEAYVAKRSKPVSYQEPLPADQIYSGPHFEGEPNIVAHARVDDRTDPVTGGKMLFAQELQSDWGQDIRKKGILPDTKGWTATPLSAPDAGFNHWEIKDANGNYVTKIVGGSKESAIAKAAESSGGVPDMPFKGNLWKKLGLRNLIRHAVEGGYDSLGWTTGDQQAARYDLSKHLDRITAFKDNNGSYHIDAYRGGDEIFNKSNLTKDQLSNTVGKELAQKIINEAHSGGTDFSGLDLKVGGEGMKGFYDKELVNIANDIGKKFGSRVEDAKIKTGEQADPSTPRSVYRDTLETVHRLPITPEMKASVMEHGQPMFMPDAHPEAINSENPAAFRTPDGKIHVGAWHPDAYSAATAAYGADQLGKWYKQHGDNYMERGFQQNNGNFVTPEQATRIALGRKQITLSDVKKLMRGKGYGEAPRGLESLAFREAQRGQHMPEVNQDVAKSAEDYMKSAGLPYTPHRENRPVDENQAKAIADHYASLPHDPNNPEVTKSYQALINETVAQGENAIKHGFKFEQWDKDGQPYTNSAAMLKDVKDNKHLWYFPTKSGFGESDVADHPMLQNVNFDGHSIPANDVFRAVHDLYGHAEQGWQFGPRGEYNAYLSHSKMFSKEALPALAMETLGQNSWVNFGPHMRGPDGSILKHGDQGYLGPTERPYAEQKANILKGQAMPEVNIGMHVDGQEKLTQHDVVSALEAAGVKVTKASVIRRDGHEPTVVATLSRALTPDEGHAVSEALGQDAIAQHQMGGQGNLFGPRTGGYGGEANIPHSGFNPEQFFTHSGEKLSDTLNRFPTRTGASGVWDRMTVDPNFNGGNLEEIAKELGVPDHERFYRQSPANQQKITDYFKDKSQAQYMPDVEKARSIAEEAHQNQTRKFTGEPYFNHLHGVASLVNDQLKPAAYLHDIFEDTPLKVQDLRDLGVPEDTIQTVRGLTRRPNEDYSHFIDRANENPDTRDIKTADLYHNLSTLPQDSTLRTRYTKALNQLIPSDDQIAMSLTASGHPEKAELVGAARDIDPGTPVSGRIDIPSFMKTGDYPIAVHDRNIGKVKGYEGILTLDNPTAYASERAAELIRDGHGKFPMAAVNGDYNTSRSIPSDIGDWKMSGFNPKKHSYFYEKGTDRPIISGDQAILDGNTVFWKNPVYGNPSGFKYMPDAPDAIDRAALRRKSDGEIITGNQNDTHFMIPNTTKGVDDYLGMNGHNLYDEGFVDKTGKWYDRGTALDQMKKLGQLPPQHQSEYAGEANVTDLRKAAFMPDTPEAAVSQTKATAQQFPEALPLEWKTDKEGKINMYPVKDKKTGKIKGYEAQPTMQTYDLDKQPVAQQAAKGITDKGERLDAMTTAAGNKLVDFYNKVKDNPEAMQAKGWYRELHDKLLGKLGGNEKDLTLFARLLAATSPNTNPSVNFGFTLDVWNKFNKGDYNDIIEKYQQALQDQQQGTLKLKNGKTVASQKDFETYVNQHQLIPYRDNGKRPGMHSLRVMDTLSDQFNRIKGLKINQFAHNLAQTDLKSTIDLWAARTLHRVLNEGNPEPWRILPMNEAGIKPQDFAFGQEAFGKAADKIGISPDDLQAILWFAEKLHYDQKGWSAYLDKGDFRPLVDRMTPTGSNKNFTLSDVTPPK